MTRRMLAVFVLLSSQSAVAQSSAGLKLGTGAAAEIIGLENQIIEHWKTQKYDDMKGFMAADASFIGSDGILRDRDKMIEANKKNACVARSVSLKDVKVTMLKPDVALITYKSLVEGMCGGKPISSAGDVNSSVWVKRNGTWLTVHHHQSPSGP